MPGDPTVATSTRPSRGKPRTDRAPADVVWREHIWMGFRYEAPSNWEIVVHSLRRDEGQIEMVDRRRQRVSFSWKRPKRQPDVQGTLDQVRENERLVAPNRKLRTLDTIGIWRGYARDDLTRLMSWDRERNLWLDMVLLWPEGRDADAEARVARSFEVGPEPPAAHMTARQVEKLTPMRWRAFGIDMTAPAGFAFDEAEVKALNVAFLLHDARRQNRGAQVRRSAMADAWFDGNLETHIKTLAGARQTIRFTKTRYRGHDAVRGESKEPTKIGTKIVRGPRDRVDLAWADEQANAVYSITTFSRSRRPLGPEEFLVEGYCTR